MESTLNEQNSVSVFSQEDLINNLRDNINVVICADFDVDQRLVISNNVFIKGMKHTLTLQESGSLYFKDADHVYMENLYINGQGSDWENNLDLVTFDHVDNVTIIGCLFADGADECVCCKNGCSNINVADCIFTYTKPPKSWRNKKNHNFALLIGKNSEDKPASGVHHVSLDNVSFIGDIRRCPRVHNAYVCMRNCTFNTSSLYTVGPENSELVFIDCEFVNRGIQHPQFIHKFGDYKCVVISNGEVVYKNPKFSQFDIPEL